MAAAAAVGVSAQRRVPIYALLSANIISSTGNALTMVAVPWFVLVTTGSAARAGVTGAISVLPVVIAGVMGGALVDRIGFKQSSVLSDLLSMVAIALIPLLFHTAGLAFWELLVLLFFARLLSSPGSTGRRSLVPELAGMADMPLERANSILGAASSLSFLIGPLLAGVLIAAMGASNVLFIDAATFGVSAALVAVLVPAKVMAHAPANERGSYFEDLREGFSYLRQNQLILIVAVVGTVVNFLMVPFASIVLPVYAKQVFGSAVQLGLILGAVSVGELAGTLAYGVIARKIPRRVTFIGAFLIAGAMGMSMAALPGLLVLMVLLAVVGLASGPLNVLVQTVIQERVAQAFLGRVIGLFGAFVNAAAPLGLLVVGILVQFAGLRLTILLETGALFVTGLGLLALPALRNME